MSLSTRIIVRLAATTLVGTAIGYGWLYVKQSRVQDHLRHTTLLQQAEELSRFVAVGADGVLDVDLPSYLSEAYGSSRSNYRYSVRDDAGRIVASSGRPVAPLPDAVRQPDRPTYEYGSIAGDAGMVGAAVRTDAGRAFFTQVEETLPATRSLNAAVLDEFFDDGGWLGIPFLLALLAISALTVRNSLSPLKEVATQAARIDAGNSTLRLTSAGVPTELRPLVSSFNHVLDRLDDGLRSQREFNADAAHQLRTPLAVLGANIDAISDRAVAAKLRYDVDHMSRLVNQLLVIARLGTLDAQGGEKVDLRAVVREAAEALAPLAISAGKSLEIDEPPGPLFVRGSRCAVAAAISNLIENALNHSPSGKSVCIRVIPTPAVVVEDSGPGVPPELREKIFERFWRGDTSRNGAGLGLSIVSRIMEALNGAVSVTDAPNGGAQFTLRFPYYDEGQG
jgi:signal transduction histidine kinase